MDYSIFKPYDIRGIYPSSINEEVAAIVARAALKLFPKGKVVIARDSRLSSLALFNALKNEAERIGTHTILDIGESTTPMFYFAVSHLRATGGVIVTASHNPKEWNGFKVVRENARMVQGLEVGNAVKHILSEKASNKIEKTKRKEAKKTTILEEYATFLSKNADFKKPMKVVFDGSNGPAGIVLSKLLPNLINLKANSIFTKSDGNFPGHGPNPLVSDAFSILAKEVVRRKADIGIVFDADADRAFFVDEKGRAVPFYAILKLFSILYKGACVADIHAFYSLRAIGVTKNIWEAPVGTYFMKAEMIKRNADFAGEYSGHYYFKDFFFTDSGILAAINVINAVSMLPYSLGVFLDMLPAVYTNMTNIETSSPIKQLLVIEKFYKDKCLLVDRTDGITIVFKNIVVTARASNTEPLIRIFVIAGTEKEGKALTQEIRSLIS